ncbi:hypothetical protein F4780DRAFT_730430 [Xylariomycetidae sp. FL0641]|nr:hypothetical protein F4780DRAFT_730430 [Xylariomycetidae sp. FL0641]
MYLPREPHPLTQSHPYNPTPKNNATSTTRRSKAPSLRHFDVFVGVQRYNHPRPDALHWGKTSWPSRSTSVHTLFARASDSMRPGSRCHTHHEAIKIVPGWSRPTFSWRGTVVNWTLAHRGDRHRPRGEMRTQVPRRRAALVMGHRVVRDGQTVKVMLSATAKFLPGAFRSWRQSLAAALPASQESVDACASQSWQCHGPAYSTLRVKLITVHAGP